MKQYELVKIQNGVERVLLESGLDAINLYLKNSGLSTSQNLLIRPLQKKTIETRKTLKKSWNKIRLLHEKYRRFYDKCLLANDRVVGPIAFYYCNKTRVAKNLAFEAWLDS
jgi:hypothetical protein